MSLKVNKKFTYKIDEQEVVLSADLGSVEIFLSKDEKHAYIAKSDGKVIRRIWTDGTLDRLIIANY